MSQRTKGEKVKPGQAVFAIQRRELRDEIREALKDLAPGTDRQEQHCEYSFRFTRGDETLAVKQYSSGALQVQGKPGTLFQEAVDRIRALSEDAPSPKDKEALTNSIPSGEPYIGIDESGKGDYFGPLVVAAVYLDRDAAQALEGAGVRDSKKLTDTRCAELAQFIKDALPGRYQVVEISPARYNDLYGQFKAEKQNLQNLLAWGHSRALESLLDRVEAQYAVSDKFGNEQLILSKLMVKGKQVRLVQEPGAERYAAVAAASILARNRFLLRLQELGQDVGVTLPKGASQAVIAAAKRVVGAKGPRALKGIAKLHFKTTQSVLEKEV